MTTPAHLFNALAALKPERFTLASTRPAGSPPEPWLMHDFQAPDTAVAPWIVGNLQVPEPRAGLAANRHGATATWRVTVAGATGSQALVVAQEVEDAWSGARLDVTGWMPCSLRPPRATGPYPAGLTATDTDLRFQVVVLEFDLAVSRLPQPA